MVPLALRQNETGSMSILEAVLDNLTTRIPGAAIVTTGDAGAAAVPCDVRHIHALRHSGSALAGVLDGLEDKLDHSRVDFVLFDGVDIRAEMSGIMARLIPHGFRVFGCSQDGIVAELGSWLDATPYQHFLAVHQRLADLFIFGTPKRLDLSQLFERYGITVAGLIHLGAHEGEELADYARLGSFPVTLIEAHPDTYRRLAAKVAAMEDVFPVHAAVTDRDGPVTFHISGYAECNSVLPVATLGAIMPGAAEQGTIEVAGRSLDSLAAEWREQGHKAASANVLVCDIQGAELLALQGASSFLPQLDAVVLEVSFDELYEGCGQVEEIDQIMADAGFARVATASVQHWSWGDALYVRRR